MKAEQKIGWAGEVAKVVRALALVAIGMAMVAPVSAQSVSAPTPASESTSPSWAKRTFGKMEWAEASSLTFPAPREVCRLVEKNVRYKTEKVDVWSNPEETWANGRGDCEDFAIAIQELCRLSGLETKIHLYFPMNGGEGHAVLVGTWEGKTWFSSNGAYEEVKSENDIRRRVARVLSTKESNLWVMKLSDRDVANYVAKGLGRTVAAR